jgi:hypothetical protein
VPKCLSGYGKEIRNCLLQVRNKGRKWGQVGSFDIVGRYGTGPAGENRLRKRSQGGSVGIVGSYGTGCRRSRTRDGRCAQVAQSVW